MVTGLLSFNPCDPQEQKLDTFNRKRGRGQHDSISDLQCNGLIDKCFQELSVDLTVDRSETEGIKL